MSTFVNNLVGDLHNRFGNDYRRLCIIFPTRRACLIFRKTLAAFHGKPVWSPGVMAIGDFVSRNVTSKVSDELPLLLALFETYKTYWPDQDFSRFYGWGQMLLNDFDEIDKQLGDPSRIFTNIREIKKIDAAFQPDAESLKWINEFVNSFGEKELTGLQKEFERNWNQLSGIYHGFNKTLTAGNISYEGRAYREFLSQLKKHGYQGKYSSFAFAGFYGLSRAEEDMIRLLRSTAEVLLYWDSDVYYTGNDNHEAGYYFRKTNLFPGIKTSTDDHFSVGKKRIEITGIPLKAGQAKYTGQLLKQMMEKGLDPDTTAVILPDENMLFPLLYSLPGEISTINVTMGYPLRQSQYAGLINQLYELHRNARNDGSLFYYRQVNEILHHPLIHTLKDKLPNRMAGHLAWQDREFIAANSGLKDASQIFKPVAGTEVLFEYLLQILQAISTALQSKENPSKHIEDTVINFIATEISGLKNTLKDHFRSVDLKTCWQLVLEGISSLKVPFSGEPVKGLQVMGFLETRALDFKTLIILDVNEGILPSASASKSFIPYSLRKGFGLPTYEDQDASFSYHFYRLLHKAEHICLLYNTEAGKTGGGEPGRYLLQLQHELKKKMGDRLELVTNTVATPLININQQPVKIIKTPGISDALLKYTSAYQGDDAKKFSASALTTYMHCPLQFYFRYLAGIKEKDEPAAGIEADVFGNILHHVLELLYTGREEITPGLAKQLEENIPEHVRAAFRKIYFSEIESLEGNDILLAEVIEELARRIVRHDESEAPFRILSLEGNYGVPFNIGKHEVKLHGKFDRVEEKDGITRIIDYKTGSVDLNNKSVTQIFSDPKKKAIFQLYFYSLVYQLAHPGTPVKAGFYVAKKLTSGISWLKVNGETDMQEFSSHLKNLISEIFDPNIPFSQTPDEKRCVYCDYKTICHR